MANERETKTAPLGLRITPALKRALEQAAADDDRTVASYAAKVLTDHLRKTGRFDPPAGKRRRNA
jgi:hypothetical protein